MAQWSSTSMAAFSSSAPTRTVFLLHGEDPFRTRLRLGELVGALLAGEGGATRGLGDLPEPRPGAPLGVTRPAAPTDPASTIALAGRRPGALRPVAEAGGHW